MYVHTSKKGLESKITKYNAPKEICCYKFYTILNHA